MKRGGYRGEKVHAYAGVFADQPDVVESEQRKANIAEG
jgi:hypothetical protein